THTYRPASELGPALERLGLPSGERVITYCTAGIASSCVAFAMALMGHEDVSIYDGSLLDWAADPALPMEMS
ncbi:MAG: rhodanese-like domain-containing protein, partial [Gemmatimonadota bacterium]